jgi:hypothetical protein
MSKKESILITTSYKQNGVNFEYAGGNRFFKSFQNYAEFIFTQFGVIITEDDFIKA